MSDAVAVSRLGRRFGKAWAVRECTFVVPAGRVCGLVGANGAGKTTMLRMLAGLTRPTTGSMSVNGGPPRDNSAFLSDIGFLAQEIPLYRRWTVADHLRMCAALNPRWDDALARDRLDALNVPLGQQIRTLSGGQRAQVALALCLAKRPRLLLLDEPVAALDPLARRDFLATLAGAVADGNLTVVLSSHLVGDLERICDYLVVVMAGHAVLAANIDDIAANHRLLTGPRRDTSAIARQHQILHTETTAREVAVWARLNGPLLDPSWRVDELSLEDIVLAYLGSTNEAAGSHPIGAMPR